MRADSGETRVLLVRHGNVHNPANLIYGRLPRMRLSPRGHEEMERTAQLLANEPIAAIYTSPLLRARQSAAHIARRHPAVPLRVCSWLVEVHTSWQGESNKVVSETRGFSYYDPLKAEGDETIQHVFDRMDRARRMVMRRHPGRTIVCVSHGDPIKILRTGLSGRPLTPEFVRAPDPGQASVVTFRFWHPSALPIIGAYDPSQAERLIRGEHVEAAIKRKAEKAAAEDAAKLKAETASP
ncbi:MAG: Phosphoglycerate mutase [Chloroflexi bacterium]|nr:Phosphoglycerate mutase [Chloroflexota bacterium]